ncbi:hypothetical protein, partial [Skermanella aerolata]|uniref:hypothetical protein n=1 Tax=Skermanella aerolata TaxID=393310 RepID=UPI001B3BFDAB
QAKGEQNEHQPGAQLEVQACHHAPLADRKSDCSERCLSRIIMIRGSFFEHCFSKEIAARAGPTKASFTANAQGADPRSLLFHCVAMKI